MPLTHPKGLRRSAELVRLYRKEPTEPDAFYEFLAIDTLGQLQRHLPASSGQLQFVDVGGGPGYLSERIRMRGDKCLVVDYNESELTLHEREAHGAVVGDGQALPLRSMSADVAHTSNVLEHVQRPDLLLSEICRILRPGGVGYVSYTPWKSPWGGHETSPWHLLSGNWAAQRYESRNGRKPKNLFGESLFNLPLPTVRKWFHENEELEVLWEGPRYWPPSWAFVSHIPLIGDTITWNYLTIFKKRSESGSNRG
jgi:ubiquinone/menaquinone biosynthesis C-methylase UbiE